MEMLFFNKKTLQFWIYCLPCPKTQTALKTINDITAKSFIFLDFTLSKARKDLMSSWNISLFILFQLVEIYTIVQNRIELFVWKIPSFSFVQLLLEVSYRRHFSIGGISSKQHLCGMMQNIFLDRLDFSWNCRNSLYFEMFRSIYPWMIFMKSGQTLSCLNDHIFWEKQLFMYHCKKPSRKCTMNIYDDDKIIGTVRFVQSNVDQFTRNRCAPWTQCP